MIETSFIVDYAPLLVALVVFIIAYAALKTLKVPANDWTLAILSLLVAFMLISSKKLVNYVFNLIPILTVLTTISFFVLLVLAFVAKDIGTFKKPLATIGFILAILLCLIVTLNNFPTIQFGSRVIELTSTIYSKSFWENVIFVIAIGFVGFILVKGK